MNELMTFKNEQFGEIRSLEIDNEPWFVGKDIATALGYVNTKDAIIKHVEEEDRNILRSQNATLENVPNRGLTIVNESGVYALIFGSKLPEAKKFKRWVTKEILPQIRKTGAYAADETENSNLKAARILANCPESQLANVAILLKRAGVNLSGLDLPQDEVKYRDRLDIFFKCHSEENWRKSPYFWNDVADWCIAVGLNYTDKYVKRDIDILAREYYVEKKHTPEVKYGACLALVNKLNA